MVTRTRDSTRTPIHVIEPRMQQRLLEHPGKWVAMTRTRIVAVGDSPTEVLRDARLGGLLHPIVYRVPEAGTGYFF